MATEKKSIGAILKADPYAGQNPYAFKLAFDEDGNPILDNEGNQRHGFILPDEEYPEGQVLRWVNPLIRERKGLRGHVMMEWDDPYIAGKTPAETRANLSKHLFDPPDKFMSTENNFITRGDSTLARLDVGMFDARQLQRRISADANLRKAVAAEKNEGLFGEGLAEDAPTRRQIMPE